MSFQASFLLNIIHFCEKQDVDGKELLKKSGIELSALGDPIPLENVDLLWKNAIDLTQDNNLGLHIGEDSSLSALGVVGQLIQNSKNIEEALIQACQFIGLLTDAFTMNLSVKDSIAVIRINPGSCRIQYPESMRQVIDSTLVFTLKEYQVLKLERLYPIKVCLDYPEPDDAKEYERIFQCPVHFNSREISIHFEDHYLYESIPAADSRLFKHVQTCATQILKENKESKSTQTLVKEAIVKQGILEFPQLSDIASLYNMSERTLQRELQEEGTGFREILDEVKMEFAIRYLNSQQASIEETSYLLGYNHPSAFTRSFKRWTGKSPREHQQSQDHRK